MTAAPFSRRDRSSEPADGHSSSPNRRREVGRSETGQASRIDLFMRVFHASPIFQFAASPRAPPWLRWRERLQPSVKRDSGCVGAPARVTTSFNGGVMKSQLARWMWTMGAATMLFASTRSARAASDPATCVNDIDCIFHPRMRRNRLRLRPGTNLPARQTRSSPSKKKQDGRAHRRHRLQVLRARREVSQRHLLHVPRFRSRAPDPREREVLGHDPEARAFIDWRGRRRWFFGP